MIYHYDVLFFTHVKAFSESIRLILIKIYKEVKNFYAYLLEYFRNGKTNGKIQSCITREVSNVAQRPGFLSIANMSKIRLETRPVKQIFHF